MRGRTIIEEPTAGLLARALFIDEFTPLRLKPMANGSNRFIGMVPRMSPLITQEQWALAARLWPPTPRPAWTQARPSRRMS